MSSLHPRRDKLIKERRHDVYRERGKRPGNTWCPDCGAVFAGGRWTWADRPNEAKEAACPACRRSTDHLPAGQVEISGGFFEGHREEILNLVRNVDKLEMGEHPLERIMSLSNDPPGGVIIHTTGLHIARRIGEALHNSYSGNLSFQYGDGEKSIRVSWVR